MSEAPRLVDLAAERFGGKALAANDEFFAPKENLLKPDRGEFIEGKYTDRGKWMDGWETRRRREPGHDWCIIRLGLPGVIRAVTVDTNHFRGNHPAACSIDAIALQQKPDATGLAELPGWREILAKSALNGHSENRFDITDDGRCTHVRLNIYPDGGVARLRVWGEVRPDWEAIVAAGEAIDLVGVQHGGIPLACSDQFFSEPLNLIMPGRARDMGDGWETRRRRGPGHDWVILRLGRRGVIGEIEVDTNHFKGNYPESCSLDACDAAGATVDALISSVQWRELLPRTKLQAHRRHRFDSAVRDAGPATHVRLNIYPDGGVSRLRILGRPADPA